jgi:hypothetical protein
MYFANPHLLETRTPNIFVAALTVALLGAWLTRLSGSAWYAVLVAAVYATCPEVFVRSSYAGYFAIGTLFMLHMLMAATSRDRGVGFAGGALAAVSDHKTLLVPAAIAAWELARTRLAWGFERAWYAVTNPVVLGFAAGTAVFWIYGLMVSPHDFWMDHVRHHLADRVLNYNARNMDLSRYPAVVPLWLELFRHTGYVLVPLGGVMLATLCAQRENGDNRVAGWRGQAGLWTMTALVMGIAFSVVDWRQTKHLAPLLLIVALAIGAGGRRPSWRAGLAVVTAGVLAWNAWMLVRLANDFSALPATPEW